MVAAIHALAAAGAVDSFHGWICESHGFHAAAIEIHVFTHVLIAILHLVNRRLNSFAASLEVTLQPQEYRCEIEHILFLGATK